MKPSERKKFDSGLAGFVAAETVLSHSDGARGILWVRGHTLPDLVERFKIERERRADNSVLRGFAELRVAVSG